MLEIDETLQLGLSTIWSADALTVWLITRDILDIAFCFLVQVYPGGYTTNYQSIIVTSVNSTLYFALQYKIVITYKNIFMCLLTYILYASFQ